MESAGEAPRRVGAVAEPPAGALEGHVRQQAEGTAPDDVGGEHEEVAVGGLFGRGAMEADGGKPAEVAGGPDAESVHDAGVDGVSGTALGSNEAVGGAGGGAV